jgi:ABC-type transport system involved in multi-copper enzyme maturation permease subunit
MITTLAVAMNIAHEALHRRRALLPAFAITLLLCVVVWFLRLDVVDGVLAATSLFGESLGIDPRPVDVVLRPVFKAVAYLIFYCGLLVQALVCAEFAPGLMSPGRIEHLLAMPIKRGELILGTFLSIWTLATATSFYSAIGFTLVIGWKSGVWLSGLLLTTVLASFAWAAVYSAMLAVSCLVRSTALGMLGGLALLLGGIAAGHRSELTWVFSPGIGRTGFAAITLLLPRISALAESSACLAASRSVPSIQLVPLLAGSVAFTVACLLFATWSFEQQDF